MNCKKIKKDYLKFSSLSFEFETISQRNQYGTIYTLYSDKFNLLKVGYAKSDRELENNKLKTDFILLDKKIGKKSDLSLLIKILKEFGTDYSGNFDFHFSYDLMRHLSTLGWPVGSSLHKRRRIKKELSFA
jgi:hypothetical protein